MGGRAILERLEQVAESPFAHRQDRLLVQKYGMTFEEFVEQRVVQQEGYTWDVEQDAMDWETAVGGMATMKRRLQELREAERV